MIEKQEISELARELSLDLHVVEKDYVLGWLLAGIAANPELSENWVFKGGTCLKKCYFETYRFSEDLDFTVTEEAQLDEEYGWGPVAAPPKVSEIFRKNLCKPLWAAIAGIQANSSA